jgi:cytochrome o ubiquinol oxidase subunit I
MDFWSILLGKLSLDALPHEPVTIGGAVMMTLGGIGAVAAMTYFKKWGWIWKNWLTSLDAKKIGVMYIVVALFMLLRGIADALMIRAQQALSVGDAHGIVSTDTFQQVFSAHGSIMIIFVAMGLIFGIINLIMPLQIGARDVAFPLMNSISFWLYIAGVVLINISLVLGEFSAAGWLAYPPLSELEYSPGVGVDYWVWALQITGVGSLLSAINFLTTIFKMRAPGMTLMKMPIFVWSVIASMSLVAFAFPILTATLAMLGLDRLMGMHFFTSDAGGNPMMYINLIWAWGHPEVYILILPAFGVFSEIVATFSSKKLFGYASMVWAIAGITFLSFLVWLHHFFTMGAGANVNAFFGIMTAVISVPTGVKVFNWMFTMYGGRVRFATPMLWFMGFVVTFTLGGVAGVLMSVPAIDFQVHNSLFLVAHFHTMIIGGVVFGFFAGFTYWFPKVFGFKLNERLGRYAFWCWLIGFLMAFVPLYALGLMGATRRLDHYDPSMGWQGLFIVAGVGVMVIGLGILMQMLQIFVSIRQRHENRDITGDPWGGRTLEWSIPSPAPSYNFTHIPQVSTRDAFWEAKKTATSKNRIPFEAIALPRNSPAGLVIGGLSFLLGFGLVWHIFWLAIVALLGIIVTIIVRTSGEDDDEEILSAVTVEKLAAAAAHITKRKHA